MIKKICISVFCITLIFSVATIKAETNIQALANYFDLLVSGNTESASYLWLDNCRERGSRFGIEYDNIPLKIDCYSPIVKDIDLMRGHLQPPAKKTERLEGGFTTLYYSAIVNGALTEHIYYMHRINDYYWLTFPQDYYTRNWETKESKYFRIRYHISLDEDLNDIALAEADKFIDAIAKELKFSKDELQVIAEKKIEYIYCETDKRVEEITGHLVKGTYDMPSNDIISAFFPHYHEIMHLLVNYKLKRLPLYALPLLREGSAVYFGGRWGKAPNTLAQIGEFLLAEDIVSIDSIITFDDFNKVATSNIAYSVAGLFSGYLIERAGIDNYMVLYRNLCGDFNSLMALTADEIKQRFADAVKVENWEKLQVDFRVYLDEIISDARLTPGISKKGKELYNAGGVIIRDSKDYYTFEISAVANDTVVGNLLFDKQVSLDGKRSSLFEEQYKLAEKFSGYRFGVRYDRNEVGVYDYATNHLIAKYIWSLRPSDDYYDEKEHKLYFKFNKDVLPFKLNKKMEFNLLSN